MNNPLDNNIRPADENEQDNRSGKYTEANDRLTQMTDMELVVKRLEEQGFTDQFKIEKDKLVSTHDAKLKYKPKDVKAVNFFRFEGISDPDDMSILLAVETVDGHKGTLIDAYGLYSDDNTAEFLKELEIHKKVSPGKVDEYK
jgi:hypothetical protein